MIVGLKLGHQFSGDIQEVRKLVRFVLHILLLKFIREAANTITTHLVENLSKTVF